jgi:hypothetical protein
VVAIWRAIIPLNMLRYASAIFASSTHLRAAAATWRGSTIMLASSGARCIAFASFHWAVIPISHFFLLVSKTRIDPTRGEGDCSMSGFHMHLPANY